MSSLWRKQAHSPVASRKPMLQATSALPILPGVISRSGRSFAKLRTISTVRGAVVDDHYFYVITVLCMDTLESRVNVSLAIVHRCND
jgi:hypothetical protein